MVNIFISYRRSDSAAQASRICDRLRQRFGEDAVFMDVETIEPGADFRTVIEQTIRPCKVFIALIGPTWTTALFLWSGAMTWPRSAYSRMRITGRSCILLAISNSNT